MRTRIVGASGLPLGERSIDAGGWTVLASAERSRGITAVHRRYERGLACAYGDRIGGTPGPPDDIDLERWLAWTHTGMLRGCAALCEPTRLFLWTDESGSCPLFYTITSRGAVLFSTQAKAIVDLLPDTRRFVIRRGERPVPGQAGSVFSGIYRVPAGTVLELVRRAGCWAPGRIRPYYNFPVPWRDRMEDVRREVQFTLEQSVQRAVTDLDDVYVTLSGGVDSSAVAAIAASTMRSGVKTVTVGSPHGGEFDQAAEVARLLGTNHAEMLMDTDALREMLPGLVSALETWDPITLQIAAPAAFIYSRIAARSAVVLTGYGADLVFAGIADHGMTEEALERAVERQVRLTVPTNEFSPALADEHDVTVRYPYWFPALLSLGISIRGRLKVDGSVTKLVLRQAAEKWLPHHVAWRPKCGIHDGSAMHRLFADCLDAPTIGEQAEALRSIATRVLLDERRVTARPLGCEDIECASF